MSSPRELMDREEMATVIGRLTEEAAEEIKDPDHAALVGIRTRGVPLARRIHKALAIEREWTLPLGILDITLYRDDLSTLGSQPMVRESHLPFDVNGRTIILVDDVLYTGRTVRSAIDAIIDFGRPKAIRLAVLIDRGLREYPIQPDIFGLRVQTAENEIVQVRFEPIDGADQVFVMPRDEDDSTGSPQDNEPDARDR
jgi:pyrimidine operon attenuation protein/uracil phosphoribosyltransferase